MEHELETSKGDHLKIFQRHERRIFSRVSLKLKSIRFWFFEYSYFIRASVQTRNNAKKNAAKLLKIAASNNTLFPFSALILYAFFIFLIEQKRSITKF